MFLELFLNVFCSVGFKCLLQIDMDCVGSMLTSDVYGIVPQCLLHIKRIVQEQRMTS